MSMRMRPLGITIIAFLVGVGALFSLCGGFIGFGVSPFEIFRHGFGAAGGLAIASLIGIVLALGSLFIAWGLWTLQRWAYWAMILVQVLRLLNIGFMYSQGPSIGALICGPGLIPLIIIIYMLVDRNVREAFVV
jgi:hypothetical protein